MDKKIEKVKKLTLNLDNYELSQQELYVLIKDNKPDDYRFVNNFDDITHDISAKYMFADTLDELLIAVSERKAIFEETVKQLHILLKMEENANSNVVINLINQYNINIALADNFLEMCID